MQSLWKIIWQFISILNLESLYDPAILVLEKRKYTQGKMKTSVYAQKCTWMVIAELFLIAQKWKQLKCPLAKGWINKRWNSHREEYYSVIKRNEVLTHTITWVKPENIIQSERSLEQKVTYYMTPFIWNVQNIQIHSDRKVLGLWEVEGNGVTASGRRFLFWGDESVLEHWIVIVMMAQPWTHGKPLNCTILKGEFYGMWIILQLK